MRKKTKKGGEAGDCQAEHLKREWEDHTGHFELNLLYDMK